MTILYILQQTADLCIPLRHSTTPRRPPSLAVRRAQSQKEQYSPASATVIRVLITYRSKQRQTARVCKVRKRLARPCLDHLTQNAFIKYCK